MCLTPGVWAVAVLIFQSGRSGRDRHAHPHRLQAEAVPGSDSAEIGQQYKNFSLTRNCTEPETTAPRSSPRGRVRLLETPGSRSRKCRRRQNRLSDRPVGRGRSRSTSPKLLSTHDCTEPKVTVAGTSRRGAHVVSLPATVPSQGCDGQRCHRPENVAFLETQLCLRPAAYRAERGASPVVSRAGRVSKGQTLPRATDTVSVRASGPEGFTLLCHLPLRQRCATHRARLLSPDPGETRRHWSK